MAPPGWDGDDLAGQMEDATERVQEKFERTPLSNMSPAERTVAVRRESLRMSHARTVSQLASATNPAYRQMLERSLQAIEAEMQSLSAV